MSRGSKQLAALAALAIGATPCAAFDGLMQQQAPGMMFYFSIPLDAPGAKREAISAGMAIQGTRPYETLHIDSRLVNQFIGGGLEAKFIVAGVLAAGAAAAVGSKDKSTAASYESAKKKQKKNDPGHFPGDGCGPCNPEHKP